VRETITLVTSATSIKVRRGRMVSSLLQSENEKNEPMKMRDERCQEEEKRGLTARDLGPGWKEKRKASSAQIR